MLVQQLRWYHSTKTDKEQNCSRFIAAIISPLPSHGILMNDRSGSSRSIYIHQVEIISILSGEVPSAFSDPVSADRDPCVQELVGAGSLAGLLLAVCPALPVGFPQARVNQIKVKSKKQRNHIRFHHVLPQQLILAEHLPVSSTQQVLKYILNIFFHSTAFNDNRRNKVI